MSKIFISHASQDNQAALSLRDWLLSNGFDEVFLDLDPETGIKPGDRWQEALLAACRDCEAVIFLISKNWLESNWCLTEYLFTKNFGKRCLPVLIEDVTPETIPDYLTAEHQIVNLVTDPTAYNRLKKGLEQAGIAAESFSLPQGRRPYPGLQALTEDDPAIFFGRDAQILEALDELRRLSESSTKRLFVILGASGSGKSSLLRAGLIPRLRRDQLKFLPLPVVRPYRASLSGVSGLWATLEGTAAQENISIKLDANFARNRSAIAKLIETGQSSLSDYLDTLRTAAAEYSISTVQPTSILAIDQAEELFSSEGQGEAKQLLELIGQILQEDSRTLVIMAMRSDAYPQLQAVECIPSHLHALFNLSPMRATGYKEVIECPALLSGLKIEPRLTEALLAETEGAEALPLLAYTLERLFRLYGADGELKLEEFQAMGGMMGVISSAVDDALCDLPRPLPTDIDALYSLLRKVFIPHLVQADESGTFTRRIAQKDEIPEKALPLIDLLVNRRLLVLNVPNNGDSGNETIEIAHEALLRSWPLLVSWLQEERNFLTWHTSIAGATRAWERNERGLLTSKELVMASDWLAERPKDIHNTVRVYIEASAQAEAERQLRERQRTRRNMLAALAASVVLLVLLLAALWQWQEADTQRHNAKVAEQDAVEKANLAQARELAIRADTLFTTSIGKTTQAAHLAMASLKIKHTVEAQQVLNKIMHLTPRVTRKIDSPWSWSKLLYSPKSDVKLNWTHSSDILIPAFGDIIHLDPEKLETKNTFRLEGFVWPEISPGGGFMAISGYARKLQIIDLKTHKVVFEQPYKQKITARFDGTGQRLFVARVDGILETRQAPTWQLIDEQRFEKSRPSMGSRLSLSFSKDGKTRMVATEQGVHLFYDGNSQIKTLDIQEYAGMSLLSPTGKRAVTVQWDRPVILWDSVTGTRVKQLLEKGLHSIVTFSSDGTRLASATKHGDIFVWDTKSGKQLGSYVLEKEINRLAFSKDGHLLASGDTDGAVHIWEIASKKQRHHWQHDSRISALAFGNNGQKLYVGDNSKFLISYDLVTGEESDRRRLSGPVFAIEIESISGAMAIAVEASSYSDAWMDVQATDTNTHELLWTKQLNGGFTSVEFNPDGKSFATTERDSVVKIWNTATGHLKIASEVVGYTDGLTYSHDSSRLVVRGRELTVIDSETGNKFTTFGEPGGINHAVYNADKNTVITYGNDFTIRAWDIESGLLKWQRDNPSKVFSINFNDDGSCYIETNSEKPWQVFDTQSDELVAELPTMSGRSEFSNDGQYLLRISINLRDRSQGNKRYSIVEIWNLETGKRVLEKRYDGSGYNKARFLPSNQVQIVSGKSLEVFDAHTGHLSWDIKEPNRYFSSFSNLPIRAKDPLLVTGKDFTEFRNQKSGKILKRYDHVLSGAILPHNPSQMIAINTKIYGAGEKGFSIALINWKTGKDIWRVRLLEKDNKGSIKKIHFSPDKRRLLLHIHRQEYQLMILDLKDGKVLGTLQTGSGWHEMWPLADPDLILAKDYSNTVRVWRLSTGTEVNRFSHTHSADGYAVARDANRVVTYTKGTLRVWDLDTLQQTAMRHTQGSVSRVAIRPDGRQVAYLTTRPKKSTSGTEFQRLVLWEPGNDDLKVISVDPLSGNLMYDASGTLLAFRMGKSSLRVLDSDSLKPVLRIQVLSNSTFRNAKFSLDSKRFIVHESHSYSSGIYAGSSQGSRVWDITSKQEIARFDGGQMVELPNTTEIAIQNYQGWQAWDIASGDLNKISLPKGWLRDFSATKDRAMLTGNTKENFWMMNVSSGKEIKLEPEQENEEIVTYNTSDLRDLVVLSQHKLVPYSPGTISLRSLPDGRELATVTPDAVISKLKFTNNNDSIILVGSPAGLWLGHGGGGTSLFLWSWREKKLEDLSKDQQIQSVAVSPDGSFFVTNEGELDSSGEGRPKQIDTLQLRMWHAATGKLLHTIPLDEPVYGIAFSADGRFLAASRSSQVNVFDTRDWSVIKHFKTGFPSKYGSTDFTKNNRLIVVGQGGVTVWNSKDDNIVTIPTNTGFPKVQVSQNGSALAIKDGGLLRVWDLEGQNELFRRHFGKSVSFAFAGKRDQLFAYDSKLGLVEISWRTQDLIDEACRRLPPLNFDKIKDEPGIDSSIKSICSSENESNYSANRRKGDRFIL